MQMKKILLVCLALIFTTASNYLLANKMVKNDFTFNENIEIKVRKWKFAVSIDGFTSYVIINAKTPGEAKRLAKAQYPTAKYIRFAGEVLK